MNPVRSPWHKNFNKIFMRWIDEVYNIKIQMFEIDCFSHIKTDFYRGENQKISFLRQPAD